MELTRSDCVILDFLKKNDYTNQFRSATLQEIMQITKNSRPTTYRKMMNLFDSKYVGKGCKAINADTFYLLEKGNKIVENKEPCIPTQQAKNKNPILYDNNSVRDKLINIMERGLLLKSIAVNAGLSESELSRFKNGTDSLKESDVKLLAEYLNEVNIPIWNNKEPEKQMSMRERILASRNRSLENRKSYRDLLF